MVRVSWNDSVTSVPSPAGTRSYRHVFNALPVGPTPNAKARPGSHTVTVEVVQYVGPWPFRLTCPRKRAPTAGPVAPSSHSASNVSGLNLPIWVTSLTSAHTRSGGAAMCTLTDPSMGTPYGGVRSRA